MIDATALTDDKLALSFAGFGRFGQTITGVFTY
jgi:hypothetical protein